MPIDDVQYKIYGDINDPPTDTSYGSGTATHIWIQINQLIDFLDPEAEYDFFFQENAPTGFIAEPRDRMRLILDDNDQLVTTSGLFEFEIVGTHIDDDGNYFFIVPNEEIGQEIQQGYVAEFFTPNPVEEKIFYEIGECWPISQLENGYFHEGGTGPDAEDQDIGGVPAVGRIQGGDEAAFVAKYPAYSHTTFPTTCCTGKGTVCMPKQS